MKYLSKYLLTSLIISIGVLASCDEDEPAIESEEEVISSVILTFSPVGEGEDVTATALDPDGEGGQDLEVLDEIVLEPLVDYVLQISLLGLEGENIGEEVANEGDEHMLFFRFSDAVFTSPDGNGNFDNRNDDVNYQDFDDNNQPLGLSTQWSTVGGTASGEFQVVLKHQPGIKSESSTYHDGATDIDVTFTINVE